jgi:hypothetical protein
MMNLLHDRRSTVNRKETLEAMGRLSRMLTD